ncbi:MAG: phosphotransferase, partial [Chloroflexota bacterium]|nr:phosphotransferase [Chloroflexota bacterium]
MTHQPDQLAAFLADKYGGKISKLQPLAQSWKRVYQVQHVDGDDWIVRVYPPSGYDGQPTNLAPLTNLLLLLERQAYPAERIVRAIDGSTVQTYAGGQVLVTAFLGPTLHAWQPTQQPAAAPFALGSAVGRLHTLPLDQPISAASMLPRRELTWVGGLLAEIDGKVPPKLQARYEQLVTTVQSTSYCEDLPLTLIHNDCNLDNA